VEPARGHAEHDAHLGEPVDPPHRLSSEPSKGVRAVSTKLVVLDIAGAESSVFLGTVRNTR
jgi:hypothetical protein